MLTSSPGSSDLAIARTGAEAVIRIGLMLVLVYWCFTIAQPFLVPIVWGMIIAVAVHPGFIILRRQLGERGGVAAWIVTLLLLVVLIVPLSALTRALIENGAEMAHALSSGAVAIPEPPPAVANWPVIGKPIDQFWRLALVNIGTALAQIAPILRGVGEWLLAFVAGAGFGLVGFLVAIIIAGVLLAHDTAGAQVADAVATRLVGDRGRDLVDLAERTVRSVARGIIGTALIQTTLVAVGLFAVGMPGAAFLTLICFLLCVVQIGPTLVLVGTGIWVFSESGTVTFVLFVGWSIIAGFSDNFLRPYLMSRGGDVPLAVIFIGAIGGLLAHGLIGLFVGPIVFALGFRLFQAWLHPTAAERDAGRSASHSITDGT